MEISSPRVLDEWTFVDEDAEVIMAPPNPINTAQATERVPSPVSEADSPHESAGGSETSDVPEGFLRLRIRLGEQTRTAHFKATQVVQAFTEQFFAEELASHKRIRLIYMGMLLLPDRTMGEYGIDENGVIHAVINDAPPGPHPEASQEVELKGLSNPVNTLLLTTGFILYGLWTLLYHYPHIFSWKSTILLASLTAIHISATVSRLSS